MFLAGRGSGFAPLMLEKVGRSFQRAIEGNPVRDVPLALADRGVHIWTIRTDASEFVAAKFQSILTDDERDRAGQLRFDHLRRQFVVTRGALRCLLGSYLNSRAQIRFEYGPSGKPSVTTPSEIQFNVTHSGSIAAFALTMNCALGIDLEQIREMPDLVNVARRFFCAQETADLLALAPEQRCAAFFRCWTRKEAYLKAIGNGLSTPLDSFRVTLHPDQPAQLVHIAYQEEEARMWTLHNLDMGPTYAAALTYRGEPRALRVFRDTDPEQFLNWI
jgi:4'-phosphopantetheinyl transferase